MRSWLFVPADSERKLASAPRSGADVLILDLEDAVAPARKAVARSMARQFLDAAGSHRGPRLFVRVNDVATGLADDDLRAVVCDALDGVMVPKCRSGADVAAVDRQITLLERETGVAVGRIRIAAIAPECAPAMFAMGSFAGCSARLCALSWGPEDLAADLGAAANRDEDGRYALPYRLAQAACLIGAAAAEVTAIDTVFIEFKNDAGLEADASAARRMGFLGKLAIHPAQVAVINRVFTPSPDEIAWATRVLEALRAQAGMGVVSLDGRMVDRPHLRLAERLMAQAAAAKTPTRET